MLLQGLPSREDQPGEGIIKHAAQMHGRQSELKRQQSEWASLSSFLASPGQMFLPSGVCEGCSALSITPASTVLEAVPDYVWHNSHIQFPVEQHFTSLLAVQPQGMRRMHVASLLHQTLPASYPLVGTVDAPVNGLIHHRDLHDICHQQSYNRLAI